MSSTAEQLKAAGNALFVKNDFSGAYKKYTEALKHDSGNAILYCNRAACSLGLNRYSQIIATTHDRHRAVNQATNLNPAYAKAWGRLAAARTSLNHLRGAVEAWQKAVAALTKDNLTPAEQKQRAQYSAGIVTAQKRLDDFEARPKHPRALAMLRTLTTWESSAWAIAVAYREWDDAVTHMKQGKVVHTPQGAGYFGKTGVVEGLTNALIADERVFHIADQDFFELYKKQLMFEMTRFSADQWTNSGSRELMEVAPKRLATEGWDSVRPALSITVRAWIMRAFVEERFAGSCEIALELLTSAVEILRWGQTVWKDVRDGDKGAIFQPTFIRGVKCLRLNAYMTAYTKSSGSSSKYTLEELFAGAQDLLDELVGATTKPQHIDEYAFFLSFIRYPAGQAHAVKGFYYNQKAKALRGTVQGLSREVINLYLEATKAFTEAAGYFPPDDESYPWYLHCALHAMLDSVGQVKCLLAILDSMKKSIPLVKRIWEFGANWSADSKSRTGGFDVHLGKDMALREDLLQKMRRQEIDGDTLVSVQGSVATIIGPSNLLP
ncbi:hypothetical protein C8T65DRAFT_675215 [Cerioporus squamosus]|nr:hypothetical protein C8T65DRAFT_675215 [Cerioporus squamosus]